MPLTVISFTLFTKWWYVLPVDAPDTMMAGFPMPYVCDGWHTSLSLQIFVVELFVDLAAYFLLWFGLIYVINTFVIQIRLHFIVVITLLFVTGLFIVCLAFIASNRDNLFYLKRPFDIEVLETGYKYIWDGNTRPENFDFEKYEREKKTKN